MKQIFGYLEQSIQSLVEKSIYLVPGQSARQLTIAIIHSLRDIVIDTAIHEKDIPNVYTIRVNPADYSKLTRETQWVDSLKSILLDSLAEANLKLPGPLSIEITPDEDIPPQKYRINSFAVQSTLEQTAALKLPDLGQNTKKQPSIIRYFLLQDQNVFALDRGIFQIGRRRDNHLVIEHPSVSRNHAQIRLINDNYVIFDLNSTSGTYLNGIKIHEAVLNPGDVITLAGFSIIFIKEGEDNQNLQEQTSRISRSNNKS